MRSVSCTPITAAVTTTQRQRREPRLAGGPVAGMRPPPLREPEGPVIAMTQSKAVVATTSGVSKHDGVPMMQ